MNQPVVINGRAVGPGHPAYIVAELSANHGQNYELAARTIKAMKESGADAVKVQTYTADTLTIACDNEYFRIGGGTLWDGKTLYDLYKEAYMPWEWTPRLKELTEGLGMDFFSTPFDDSAVDFLEALNVPCHKIASFELVDLPLLRRVAATGKPVIASTGMASLEEIHEAVETMRGAGNTQLILLKCTSAYPAPAAEMDLRTIPDIASRFGVPAGLSDHTMGHTVPVAAVALGACVIEKHFILSREAGGPDAAFSMQPAEFRVMVDAVRTTEQALGTVNYEVSEKEMKSRLFRRSLFAVEDIAAGELLTDRNVRSIRPGHGLHTRHWPEILGKPAATRIAKGTPLALDLLK